jgi:hypothetical protein
MAFEIIDDERIYVQRFVDSPEYYPDILKMTPDNEVLVWANELVTENSRAGGDPNRADLLTVDEDGLVWIIEAKLRGNTELNPNLWERQPVRYRDGLMSLGWDHIHGHTYRFIAGNGAVSPYLGKEFCQSGDLRSAIAVWQKQWAKRSKHSPDELIARMAKQLSEGTCGLAILADADEEKEKQIIAGAKNIKHKGPLAYLRGIPYDDGLHVETVWSRPGTEAAGYFSDIPAVNQLSYLAYRSEANALRCRTVEHMVEGFCDGAKELWTTVLLPELTRLGWEGNDASKNRNSITALLPAGSHMIPAVQIGWADAVGKSIPPEYRVPGNKGMKVFWYSWSYRNKPYGQQPFIERWAKEFYRLGWRGADQGRDIGLKPIRAHQYNKWNGCMLFAPTFYGAAGQRELLLRFTATIERFLTDAKRQ